MAGASLHTSGLSVGGSGAHLSGAWLQSAGAGVPGRHAWNGARVDETPRSGSTGVAVDRNTAASVTASEGSGAAMMMLDDPWEQLFGPEGRPL